MEAAVVSFEGEAFMWYQWEDQKAPLNNWLDLKSLILKHFRPLDEGDMYEQWMVVKQKRSVAKYIGEFVTKLTHLEKITKSVMSGVFLRGLKEEVKTQLGTGRYHFKTGYGLG